MKYSITREELVQLIESAPRPALKQILTNHLNVMDGQNTVCVPCSLFDELEQPEFVEEIIEDSEDEYPDESNDEEE